MIDILVYMKLGAEDVKIFEERAKVSIWAGYTSSIPLWPQRIGTCGCNVTHFSFE